MAAPVGSYTLIHSFTVAAVSFEAGFTGAVALLVNKVMKERGNQTHSGNNVTCTTVK